MFIATTAHAFFFSLLGLLKHLCLYIKPSPSPIPHRSFIHNTSGFPSLSISLCFLICLICLFDSIHFSSPFWFQWPQLRYHNWISSLSLWFHQFPDWSWGLLSPYLSHAWGRPYQVDGMAQESGRSNGYTCKWNVVVLGGFPSQPISFVQVVSHLI